MKIDRIVRTPRKSIALVIEPDGSLLVRAPLRASRAQIQAVIDEHQDWIHDRQETARLAAVKARTRFSEGASFYYLGNAYPLALVEGQRKPLKLGNRFYLAKTALPRAPEVFAAWYRQQARQVIPARVAELASLHGFQVKTVRINQARTRWGSCSTRGSLNFTWRLVMAPPEVVDYVILHELAHLRERNHSKNFWAVVEMLLPAYRQPRQWLKENGAGLIW